MSRQLEQKLQEQFATWLDCQTTPGGSRILYCASAGGMRVSMRTAIKMKRAGYKRGHPDITIYEPRGGWYGMLIELKVKGYPTPEQRDWQGSLRRRGYYAIIIPGRLDFWEARKFLEEQTDKYLKGEIKNGT